MPQIIDWAQPYVQAFFDLLPEKNMNGWIPTHAVNAYAEAYGWSPRVLNLVVRAANISYLNVQAENNAQ